MAPNGSLRILLIEDNKDDEELIRIALRKAGLDAIMKRIETEGELLRALEESEWDLIICDFLMPHFKAARALEVAREKVFDIPFIMLSGYEDEPIALEMLKLGASDFVYKSKLPRLPLAIGREIKQAGERARARLEVMRSRIDIERNYALTVEAWGVALEKRDIYTKDHTIRVTDLTLRLARALEVSGTRFRSIQYGALLHDIGKMGIPDKILLKEGPLENGEITIMRMHPGIAYDMLKHIEFLRDSVLIPYCHHEKYNGTGYPRGLEGDLIPIEARIFTVCDVFDAITHNRPYRLAWDKKTALEYLSSERGKTFDPAILDKFLEVIKR